MSLFSVDFTKAKRLDRGGSTCDAYECSVRRRRVFVKRLKAEYRNNPLYRAAFEKEFDVGVSLSHPSLPRYLDSGDGYIVMDFIEGETLADLLKRGDRRLKDKRYVGKLLSELIDAVEYLHNRNVVHCDIKADNIIISPYSDRPATLIDLDKAYTDWLGDTSGDPKKYDSDNCSDGTIDFRGIGRIAGQLGLNRVAAVCSGSEVTAETIRKSLNRRDSLRRVWLWLTFAGIMVAGLILYLTSTHREHLVDDATGMQEIKHTPLPNDSILNAQDITLPPDQESVKGMEAAIKPEIKKEEKNQGETSDDLDQIVIKHYGPLYRRHEYLYRMLKNPYPSAKKLQMIFKTYADDQLKAQGQIMREVMERYELTDQFEILPVLGTSMEWGRFMEEDYKLNQLYFKEIKRLEEATDSISR